MRTGFDQWFEVPGAPPPPAWKQNMVVLLVLYPLVFLLNAWLQKPILVGVFGLPLLGLSFHQQRRQRRHAQPDPAQGEPAVASGGSAPQERDGKRDVAGALLVAGFYTLWLLAFWLYQTRIGSPFP